MLKKYKGIIFNVIMALVMAGSMAGVFGPENPAPTDDQLNVVFDQVDAAVTAVWTVGNAILLAVNKYLANKAKKE